MVNKVCWFSWIPNIEEVHVLTEACEIEGRKAGAFQKIDSAGEAQAWAEGNACVESCPNVTLKRMCVTQRCHCRAKQSQEGPYTPNIEKNPQELSQTWLLEK